MSMANTIRGLLPDGTLPTTALEQVQGIVDGIDIPEPAVQGVPIFETLAEAEAWEVENPGKIALTLEGQEPPEPDEPPIPGFLQVLPADVSASLTVTGASDAEGGIEYSFRVDGGAWTDWQQGAAYSAEGLSKSTKYQFQHRVRDTAGTVVEGVSVEGTTLAEAPVPYQQLALSYSPKLFFPGPVGKNLGTMAAGVYRDSGTEGAPLGGYASSRRFTSDSEGLSFRSDAMPSDWPEWSSVFLVNLTAGEPEHVYVILTTHNNPTSLVYVALDRRGVDGLPELRLATYHGAVEAPGSTGPMLIGIECDGTATRYYLNGVPVETRAARTLLRSTGRHGFEPSSMTAGDMIEVAGWLVHDQALGPDAHLALAEAAGVA